MKMYDNILEKVKIYEEKRGITYAKPGGKLHKYVKAIYVLVFIYTLAMNMFFAIGVSISDERMQSMSNSLYTVLAFSAGLIAAFVLTFIKDKILPQICSVAINVVCCVGLVVAFAPLMENITGGYKGAFFWRHFIPLCLLIIINLVLNIIVIRAVRRLSKTYKKIVDNIYSMNHTSIEDGSIDEEEWEEILKNV